MTTRPAVRARSAVHAALAMLLIAGIVVQPAVAFAQDASRQEGYTIQAVAQQARVRTALGAMIPPERDAAQVGAELGLPTPLGGLRVHARMLRGTQGDDLESLDAGLIYWIGPVGIEGAWAQRASYSPRNGLAHGRMTDFARAGLRTGLELGLTGFSMHLRANAYVPTRRAALPEDDIEGWDGDTGLTYRHPGLPVSATLGYRLERFRIFGVEQEVSALTFALGFTLFGR